MISIDALKLAAIFAFIILLLKCKCPLWFSILCGTAATGIIYQIGISNAALSVFHSITGWETLSVILTFYLITFLQRMLEKRDHLNLAHRSLNGLFHSRRVNASIAPVFIGLLPSAGAVLLCAPMVDTACGDYLSREDKTFVTSYFRHIPESCLPTYSSILITVQLSGVSAAPFLLLMFPMVVVLFLLGYLFYLRKIPKDTGEKTTGTKCTDLKNLVKSLWTIALTIALILIFNLSVYAATVTAIVLCILINRFRFSELRPMFASALEWNIVINTIVVMIFKGIMTTSGAINTIPQIFAQLPIPSAAIFALVFFFGTIISGSLAIIVLCIPLAYAAMPDGGSALMMLLMCYTYAAMQISPTHICLTIVTEFFHTEMSALLKRTVPVMAAFCAIVAGYYLLLQLFV